MDRRRVLQALGAGSLAAVTAPLLVGANARSAYADLVRPPDAGPEMQDMGAGIYWDLSTASQLSTWSIQPTLCQCAVGTVGAGGLSGPFGMLMYSVSIDDYDIQRSARTLVATGRMRSITIIAMTVEENVEHDFICVATDNRGVSPDRFDVHFTTPMWGPSNPMATPSGLRPGWSRFGGFVASSADGTPLGGVTVNDPA